MFAMVVPDELPSKLDQFDLLAIQRADDLGPPVFVNERQFLREIDLVHDVSLHQSAFILDWPAMNEIRLCRSGTRETLFSTRRRSLRVRRWT